VREFIAEDTYDLPVIITWDELTVNLKLEWPNGKYMCFHGKEALKLISFITSL